MLVLIQCLLMLTLELEIFSTETDMVSRAKGFVKDFKIKSVK